MARLTSAIFVGSAALGLALASTSFPEFFVGYVLVFFLRGATSMASAISTVYDGMPFGERIQAIALPAAALTLAVLFGCRRLTARW